jgi:hypothetical protein
MNERFHASVILCWPSNRKDIDRLNRLNESAIDFVPTIDHQLSECDSCKRSVWITKEQLQMARSPLFCNNKLCMFCVGEISKRLNVALMEIDIAPHVAHSRRRKV